ncbi:hypothetical protein RA166_01540 [Mycetohabitans endofungorum]|nr:MULTISPECIES: hypothetical protein [Burkholderiaceae]
MALLAAAAVADAGCAMKAGRSGSGGTLGKYNGPRCPQPASTATHQATIPYDIAMARASGPATMPDNP